LQLCGPLYIKPILFLRITSSLNNLLYLLQKP